MPAVLAHGLRAPNVPGPSPQLAASTHKHAEAALEESRQRAAREQRMARLKVHFGVALQYACHASERGAPAMAAVA